MRQNDVYLIAFAPMLGSIIGVLLSLIFSMSLSLNLFICTISTFLISGVFGSFQIIKKRKNNESTTKD